MLTYLAPRWDNLLSSNQLATFSQIWAYEGDWFEPPNRERGGWSGVNFLTLSNDSGQRQALYLKRQQGFTRRTLMHPFAGEPTFTREYKVMQYLHPLGVSTPQIVFFAQLAQQAILITEALTGYLAWDAWRSANVDASHLRKKAVIAGIAKEVKKMHQAGVQHRSLYPKHLFVRETNGLVNVAIIDFEKSRITPLIALLKLSDLITLNYRTLGVSRTQRLYFFKKYLGVTRLSQWQKRICCYIYQQSLKKSSIK